MDLRSSIQRVVSLARLQWSDSQETYKTAAYFVLGVLFIGIGLLPLYPQIRWYVSGPPQAAQESLLAFAVPEYASTTPATTVSSSTKRLRIPSIGVDMEVVDEPGVGEQEAFERGAWLLPRTAIPGGDPGNAVIAAHRYLYTEGPNTFFHLDKLSEGDEVFVDWRGETYTYIVQDSTVVPPTAVEILEQTDETILTLFTCTPVYTTKNRLVVTAKLST